MENTRFKDLKVDMKKMFDLMALHHQEYLQHCVEDCKPLKQMEISINSLRLSPLPGGSDSGNSSLVHYFSK